jgi:predicted secreted protein
MATTGIINGTDLLVYVGGVAILGATTHSLSLARATRDTTNKDTASWQTVLSGRKNWSISGSHMFSFDAAYGHSQLFALLDAGASVTVKFSTDTAGNKHWSGSAVITKLDIEAGDDANTTYSYEFAGTGALTEVTTT